MSPKSKIVSLVALVALAAGLFLFFSPLALDAGDNLDAPDSGANQIYDIFWDPRIFGDAVGFPGFVSWAHNAAGMPAALSKSAFEATLETSFAAWEAVDDGLPEEPLVPRVTQTADTTAVQAAALDGINAVVWKAGAPSGVLATTPCYRLVADTTTEDDGLGNTVMNFSGGITIPFPGPVGVTYPKGALLDCGIEFDSADSWSTTGAAGTFDVQSVATHEIGHFLGLSHSTVGNLTGVNAVSATMAPFGIAGNTQLRTLQEDDKASVLRTYARNANPIVPQTVGGRGVIQFDLRKGLACAPATGVSVWAYRTADGLAGANRVETFSGSEYRAGIGDEPYNGSVTLNVAPLAAGDSYTIFARSLENDNSGSATSFSAYRYNYTTINSNTLEPPGATKTYEDIAVVDGISAGEIVDLGSVGILGCWAPVSGSNIDLIGDSVSAPAEGILGGQVAVTSSFTNQGSAAAGPFEAGIYFSLDATINQADTFAGFSCAVPALAGGASGSCDGLANVPALSPGDYYVGLLADRLNDVGESNEANNGIASVTTISIISNPLDPIVNGSFETGDLSGWSVKELDMTSSNPFLKLGVQGAGVEYPAATFVAFPYVLDYFASAPTDGQYAVLHDWNGNDTSTSGSPGVNLRELYQDVTLPDSAITLTFDYRAAWELFRFGATVPRTFSVRIEPAGGGTALINQLILPAELGIEEDTDNPSGTPGQSYPPGLVDIGSLAGQDVRIKFVWDVPEPGTGFAFFQLDNVRVSTLPNTPPAVTISSPATGSIFNLGDSIDFVGTAQDDEQGDLTANLSWSSDLDGVIGSGGSFSTAALSLGTHVISASVVDSGSLSGSDTVSVTLIENTAPQVTITNPTSGASFSAGTSIGFSGTALDGESGDLAASLSWTSDLDGPIGSGASFSAALSVGTHAITASVTDPGGLPGSDAIAVTVTAIPPPTGLTFEQLVVPSVGSDSWTTVALANTYSSLVTVCSPVYDNGSTPPLAVRIRNAAGNSFEVRLGRATNAAGAVSGVAVHCLAVEEGVYNVVDHGVKMEAVKYLSTLTDRKSSWVGEARSYANSYASPVVLGQVMSYNDSAFSVFWSHGASRTAPASGSALFTGKHVGEDPNFTRANETIGYIVIESGSGTMGSLHYVAALGGDIVTNLPKSYPLSGLTSASTAIVSQAAMDGNDGSWALMPGPLTPTALPVAVDEDQFSDSERTHSNEQLGYLVFE